MQGTLCSPLAGQGKGWSCPAPLSGARLARRDGIFSYLPGIAGTWRMFLVGWRTLASSRRDPGAFPVLCSAGTVSSWSNLPAFGPALLTLAFFPLSSFSLSFLPHRSRGGAARAAFVKHFKAPGVRGHARPCQGSLCAEDPRILLCQGSRRPCPPVCHPPLFLHN